MKLEILFFLIFFNFLNAQKDGYWDKERATTKEVTFKAGDKIIIKTEDLPIGTTEIIYRITLLDENQKLTNSLASVLKSIPSAYTQGAAGLIQLTSAVSGDDKCTYSVFTSLENTNLYLKNEKYTSCFEQNEKVSKDARLLNANTLCLTNIPDLWFGFKNENWFMNQKIVLEVVPWVDLNASRGWTKITKNEILELGKQTKINNFLPKNEAYLATFLEIFTTKYKYNDFKNLIEVEKSKVVEDIAYESLQKSKTLNLYLKNYSENLKNTFSKNPEEAISELVTLNETRKLGNANEYDLLGMFYLQTKQFEKAEEWITKAIEKDKTKNLFKLHLAHVYMFTDRFSDAKDLHKKYKNQNVNSKTSWVSATKNELETFEKAGLDTENFKKVLRIFE